MTLGAKSRVTVGELGWCEQVMNCAVLVGDDCMLQMCR